VGNKLSEQNEKLLVDSNQQLITEHHEEKSEIARHYNICYEG
jgi:hypothetical protein